MYIAGGTRSRFFHRCTIRFSRSLTKSPTPRTILSAHETSKSSNSFVARGRTDSKISNTSQTDLAEIKRSATKGREAAAGRSSTWLWVRKFSEYQDDLERVKEGEEVRRGKKSTRAKPKFHRVPEVERTQTGFPCLSKEFVIGGA